MKLGDVVSQKNLLKDIYALTQLKKLYPLVTCKNDH